MKSDVKVTILGKTFNSFKLVEKLWGKKGTYILDWDSNRDVRKVEILIKQAGMIPYFDIQNEVERATVLDRLFQHHIRFDEVSTDTIDLILLGDLHPVLNDLWYHKDCYTGRKSKRARATCNKCCGILMIFIFIMWFFIELWLIIFP